MNPLLGKKCLSEGALLRGALWLRKGKWADVCGCALRLTHVPLCPEASPSHSSCSLHPVIILGGHSSDLPQSPGLGKELGGGVERTHA